MTEGTRSWIQVARTGFLCRVAGASLRERVRSSVIQERLGPLLLSIERNQWKWFGHLVRMPPGHLPREVSWLVQLGEDLREGPEAGGEILPPLWPAIAWGCPGQSWPVWPRKTKSGAHCLSCYPHDQISDKQKWMNGWMNG